MIASVVLPALDDPLRKMTLPVFMAKDGIWMAGERQLAERSRCIRFVREEVEALQAAVDRVIPIREGLTVLVGEVADELESASVLARHEPR